MVSINEDKTVTRCRIFLTFTDGFLCTKTITWREICYDITFFARDTSGLQLVEDYLVGCGILCNTCKTLFMAKVPEFIEQCFEWSKYHNARAKKYKHSSFSIWILH